MSETSNTKQKDGHNVIMVDKQNGLTLVLASHRVRIPNEEIKGRVEDLAVIENPCTVTTNLPAKNEFSFRDESVETSEAVEKAFDDACLEENQLFCPICGGLLREEHRGNYVFVECMSCSLAVQGSDDDDPETACEEAWREARFFLDSCPPVLRLQPGDKLHFIDRPLKYQYYAVVTDVDVKDSWIRTDKGSCRPDDVLKWPWEIKQAE
jgi:hypothetical protein